MRFPTDEQLFSQFKIYLCQKLKQLEYLCTIYKENKEKKQELAAIKRKIIKINNSKLI